MTTIGLAARAWRQERAVHRPARRESLVVRAAVKLARTLPTLRRTRSAVMQTAACGAIDVGLFQWDSIAGWVGVGVSLFVLEALSGGER